MREEDPFIILVTGHPATGKTMLSHSISTNLKLPLIGKDIIKETLADALEKPTSFISDNDWSRRLSQATWKLLYLQTTNLIKSRVSHIVEANFDPIFADSQWQCIVAEYDCVPIQIRCEADANTILNRYAQRVENKTRHMIHVNARPNPKFEEAIQSHLGWINIAGPRLSFDSSKNTTQNEVKLFNKLKDILPNEK